MNKDEIIKKVKSLKLKEGSYVVFGSGPMAAAGIRNANDIDLYVTTEVLESLKNQGWKMQIKGPGDNPLTFDCFEAHDNWNFSSYSPTLDKLLRNAITIEGVSFASLEDVRKWKTDSDNPKYVTDVKLIDEYLSKK